MSHDPVRYQFKVATSALLSTFTEIDAGDEVFVSDLGEAFTYDASSTEALDPDVVLDGPGGVGRFILSSRHIYGGLYCHQGATPQNVSAVPAKLTCWNGQTPSYKVATSLVSQDGTIDKPGAYQLALSLSGTASGNLTYNFHVHVNGSEVPGSGITRLGSANNPLGGTSVAFAKLNQGDVVSAFASASGNGVITIVEGSLTVVRMG